MSKQKFCGMQPGKGRAISVRSSVFEFERKIARTPTSPFFRPENLRREFLFAAFDKSTILLNLCLRRPGPTYVLTRLDFFVTQNITGFSAAIAGGHYRSPALDTPSFFSRFRRPTNLIMCDLATYLTSLLRLLMILSETQMQENQRRSRKLSITNPQATK